MSSTSRSVFAVLDALLLFIALEAVFYAITFLGLNLSFDTPTTTYLTVNLLWALIVALITGYTAARVARHAPVRHGIIVAIPLIALAVFNLHKDLGNRRTPYVLGINILVPLFCIAGSWLYAKARPQQSHRP